LGYLGLITRTAALMLSLVIHISANLQEYTGQPAEFFQAALARLTSAPAFYMHEQMAKIDAPAQPQLVSGDPVGRYYLSVAAVSENAE
jgi:hypothetical protein